MAGYQGFAGGSVGGLATMASALRLAARAAKVAISDEELRMMLGHAAFESGYGKGDPKKNTLANTNNWGSMQVTKGFAQAHKGQQGYGAVAHQDSDPNRGPFVGWYAVLPSSAAGAAQFFGRVSGHLSGGDVDAYAASLYHSSYYGGVHKDDPEANIRDYASAIRRAMPGAVPADSPASIAAAQAVSVGPFAPFFDRVTAVERVNGRPHGTEAAAAAAWAKSWSHPAAYGITEAIDFARALQTGGVVWFGPAPPGFSSGGDVIPYGFGAIIGAGIAWLVDALREWR